MSFYYSSVGEIGPVPASLTISSGVRASTYKVILSLTFCLVGLQPKDLKNAEAEFHGR